MADEEREKEKIDGKGKGKEKRKLNGAANEARRQQNLRTEDAKMCKKLTDMFKRGKKNIIILILFSNSKWN